MAAGAVDDETSVSSLRFHIQFAWTLKYCAMCIPAKRFSAGPLCGSYSDIAAPDAVVRDRASAESVDTPNNAPVKTRGSSWAAERTGISVITNASATPRTQFCFGKNSQHRGRGMLR